MARVEKDTVRTEQPTALLALVCRGRGKRTLRVTRTLEGESITEFPPTDVAFDAEPCVQIRDMIPPRTMTEGRFAYRVRILDGETELASAVQTIYAVEPDAARAADGG